MAFNVVTGLNYGRRPRSSWPLTHPAPQHESLLLSLHHRQHTLTATITLGIDAKSSMQQESKIERK
jgi:hypothetical protein